MKGTHHELKNVTIKTISENTTGATRSAKITFAAGRLRYPVTVHQSTKVKASITLDFGVNGGIDPDTISFPIEFVRNEYGTVVGVSNQPIPFTVKWTPTNEALVVYKTTVNGIQYANFDATPNMPGVQAGLNGQLEGSIVPARVVGPDEVVEGVSYERAMKLVFFISNGSNTVEKTVVFRHVWSEKSKKPQ
jgi:hypothetical protein